MLVFVFGCKDDSPTAPEGTNDGGGDESTYNLNLTFQNGYIETYGIVIVHSSDGEQIDFKELTGDGTISFTNLTEQKVTITIADLISYSNGDYYNIRTFKEIAVGDYILGNNYIPYAGTVSLIINFPEGEYNYINGSLPYYIWSSSRSINGGSTVLNDFPVYASPNEKFGAMVSIINNITGKAFYSFKSNLTYSDVQSGLEMDAITPLKRVQINCNKSINSYRFGTSINNGQFLNHSYLYNLQESSTLNIYYADELMDESLKRLTLGGPIGTGGTEYSYEIQDTSIVSSISVPEADINGNWDESTQTLRNINLTGQFDIFTMRFTADLSSVSTIYDDWSLYAPINSSELSYPTLTDEVKSKLNYNSPDSIAVATRFSIRAYENNLFVGYDEAIIKSSFNYYDLSDKYYRQMWITKYLDNFNGLENTGEKVEMMLSEN